MMFIDLALPRALHDVSIATLGPTGTSSEAAAESFLTYVKATRGQATGTQLHKTYESAEQAVLEGKADFLIVANAYANISRFYMNPTLRLIAAFVYDTPAYGIAAPPDRALPGTLRVATHPAPRPLIGELMPEHLQVVDVVCVSSTSAAAHAARSGEVDAALTTAPAALVHGLKFISRTRCIRMLWSVFGARGA